jgi:hypothetical protein
MTPRKFALIALSMLGMIAAAAGAENLPLNKVHLPPGFEIGLFCQGPQRALYDAQPKPP